MTESIGYMVAPLGLTERQILIYQKLYEKCNFADMTVKYTINQLSCDIKIIDIPTKTIYKNIQDMIKKGYLEVIQKASKGNAPVYRIITINEIVKKKGEPKVSQERTKREPKHSIDEGLSIKLESQKRTKREPKCHPIKEKEKEIIYIDLTFIDDVIDKVKITQEQYEKLVNKFGSKITNTQIMALDNYIANGKGAKYKDHYRALNIWCNSKTPKESSGQIKLEDMF